MPFNGSGLFTRLYNWTQDAANGIDILPSRFDTEDNDFAGGLSNCITRDGQGMPSAAIDWNGQNLTGINNLSVGGTATLNGTANLNGGGTSTTPSSTDNSTNIATTAFVRALANAGAIASPGYIEFTIPGTSAPLIFQFGNVGSIAGGAAATIYFPITFPTAVFALIATPGGTTYSSSAASLMVQITSTSSAIIYNWATQSVAGGSYLAIGH